MFADVHDILVNNCDEPVATPLELQMAEQLKQQSLQMEEMRKMMEGMMEGMKTIIAKIDPILEAENKRKAEEDRKVEEARKAEEMRMTEEKHKADAARKAEQTRKANEARDEETLINMYPFFREKGIELVMPYFGMDESLLPLINAQQWAVNRYIFSHVKNKTEFKYLEKYNLDRVDYTVIKIHEKEKQLAAQRTKQHEEKHKQREEENKQRKKEDKQREKEENQREKERDQRAVTENSMYKEEVRKLNASRNPLPTGHGIRQEEEVNKQSAARIRAGEFQIWMKCIKSQHNPYKENPCKEKPYELISKGHHTWFSDRKPITVDGKVCNGPRLGSYIGINLESIPWSLCGISRDFISHQKTYDGFSHDRLSCEGIIYDGTEEPQLY